jgi:hypothetical protein
MCDVRSVIWDEKPCSESSLMAHLISRSFRALNLSWEAPDGTAKPEGFFIESAPENALGREDTPHHKKQFHQD